MDLYLKIYENLPKLRGCILEQSCVTVMLNVKGSAQTSNSHCEKINSILQKHKDIDLTFFIHLISVSANK